MRLLTIHCSFRPSPVLLLVALSGITWAQPTMCLTLKTCIATAASAFLTCTNSETGSKLLEFSGIVVSARDNQYSTQSPSSFGAWFWMLVVVATGDAHSVRHNTSPGIALPTSSHSVDPLCRSSSFLCIDPSEIFVHLLNSQLEP